MRDLAAVAEQLRVVRAAEQEFLRLWAMEQAVILPGLDRVAADLSEFDGCAGPITASHLRTGGGSVDEPGA